MTIIQKMAVALLLCVISTSSLASRLAELVQKYKNVNQHIEQQLTTLEHPSQKGLNAIYKNREYRSIWVHDKDRYIPLLESLSNADSHGLNPADYDLDRLAKLLSKSSGSELAQLDIQFSLSFLAYAEDMVNGRFSPKLTGDNWFIEQPTYKPLRDLYKIAINTNDDATNHYLKKLEPPFKAYQALRKQLNHYQTLVLSGGWPTLTGTELIEEGDKSPEIVVLRKRLALAQVIKYQNNRDTDDESSLIDHLIKMTTSEDGSSFLGLDLKSALERFQQSDDESELADVANAGQDHKVEKTDPEVFDTKLANELKIYQQQHGLEPDGLLGETSRRMLNISAEERLRQILLNLERFRWLPRDLPQDYVWVDVAAFKMSVVYDKKTALTSPVIVGKEGRETPAFQDEISYLEFNPYWNIPNGILYKDIIPKASKDPNYLTEKQIKIYEDWSANAKEIDPSTIKWEKYSGASKEKFTYRLRQEPGVENSLGLIKFIFPNEYSIYLHDTPHRELFEKSQRYFSSGCIRVQEYEKLAAVLLNNNGARASKSEDATQMPVRWTEALIAQRLSENRNEKVFLKESLPVFIVYFTTWVDTEGEIQFRDDIYDRDKKMQALLAAEMQNFTKREPAKQARLID